MIANVPWHEELGAAIGCGGRAVVVAVAGAAGSTPRESGATMVVTRERIAGTIGGGHLEYEAMRLAREALAGDAIAPAHWLVRFPLAARLGQCCGGVATLAFATVDATATPWLEAVTACARASEAFAVIGRLGSGDAAAARLLVTADDARGTLGEALLDSAAVTEARARLAGRPGDARAGSAPVDLAGVPLFVHVTRPAAFPVCVFGNGHVGRALVQVLGALPASVQWVDTREHDFPAGVPRNVAIVVTDDPPAEVDRAPRGAYLVVVTHSHTLDFDIVESALRRDDWRYLGLIGSRTKRNQFERRLEARGFAPADLARVTCPIGRGDLLSKEPGVIAVAVAAEILAIREAPAIGAHEASTTRQPPRAPGPAQGGMRRG
jgi:xanthine dehydrogenase accessory factor